MSATFKVCLCLLVGVCLSAALAGGVDSGKVTYYVQLIRGSNDANPPAPGSTAIGKKLAKHLRPVFSWTNYWEIARQEVPLATGQKTRVPLSKEREVEIDLTTKGKRTVVVFSGGEAVSRLVRPISESMTIIGGDRDKETAWFIVVRRDRPPN